MSDTIIEVEVDVPGEPPRSWTFGTEDTFAPELSAILLGGDSTRPVESLTANLVGGGTLTWRLVR